MTRHRRTYKSEAVIELSAPLLLGPEFLGLLKPASIGGVEVHVVLPNFRRGIVQTGTVLHQRAQVDWLDFFKQRNPEDDRDWPFGGVSRWGKGDRSGIEQFSAHRFLVMPKGPLTLREARKMKATVDDWVELFEMWIDVVAREDLHRRRVWIEHQGRSAVVWLDRGKGLDGGIVAGDQRLMLHLGATFDLTPWQWGKILTKTSRGMEPPQAHIFVRDARKATNLGHYRRSVLDSATAAELALAKLRDDSIAGNRADIAGHVQETVRQIEGLARFLRRSRTDIPSDIKEAISEPRNMAIHAGRELDEQTAKRALATAEQVVALAFPWNKLL